MILEPIASGWTRDVYRIRTDRGRRTGWVFKMDRPTDEPSSCDVEAWLLNRLTDIHPELALLFPNLYAWGPGRLIVQEAEPCQESRLDEAGPLLSRCARPPASWPATSPSATWA